MTTHLKDGKAPVVEIFGPTIQGEGILAGVVTWFVRLGQCDYYNVCDLCDSMHAVDPKVWKKNATWMTPEEIADKLIADIGVSRWKSPYVTFSGGNPALWDMSEAVIKLHARGIRVAVETQGTKYLPWLSHCNVLTVSPKGPGMLTPGYDVQRSIDAFENFLGDCANGGIYGKLCIKIPVFSHADLNFAEKAFSIANDWSGDVGLDTHKFLSVGNASVHQQAVDVLRESLLTRYESIVEQMLSRPSLYDVSVLPQLHVLIWGNKQGV